jgi:hypothetical protein
MMKRKTFPFRQMAAVLLILAGCHVALFAQWSFDNSSFEGDPQDATVPQNWIPCKAGTTPDILPGPWGVYTEPADGKTFVGLITREDGTWESIGQRTKQILKAKECYAFSIDLAHSDTYAGYNLPIRLRVWGGYDRCAKDQLLGETDLINHTDWVTYPFQFYPAKEIRYIILEAHYAKGVAVPYKGNVLLDHLSPIKNCTRADAGSGEKIHRG